MKADAGRAGRMEPQPYRVERYMKETYDIFTIGLKPSQEATHEPASGGDQRHFSPGQFNMLYVFGMGEVPISICGDPSGAGLLTHTTRAVGNITKAMSALRVGDMIGVRGPFGAHWPMERTKGKDVVLVAGGIGFAPLRPVILAMLAARENFRSLVLLYGTRSPRDILFRDDLKKWKAQPGMEVHITVDKGIGSWRGSVGAVTRLIPQIPLEPANTIAMICGPEIMMHFTVDALRQRGVSAADIYVSMERNMKCAVGFCGHCQFGPHFICKDGPVFPYDRLASIFRKPEI